MAHTTDEDVALLAARLHEDNRRLVAEVQHLRETIARLQQDLLVRTQLLGLWKEMHEEHRTWLLREIERIARHPVGIP